MSVPVSGRTGGTSFSLDELVGAQGAAPPLLASPGVKTSAPRDFNSIALAPPPPSSADAPREFPTGRMDYYRRRHEDFVSRNPGQQPPPYYLEYGDKYVRAFSALGAQELSPEGLAWRDRALKLLQDAMETRRQGKPAEFAALERNPKDFQTFAYATHAKAYLDAGLFSLPTQDLTTILTTPDLRDLLNPDGMAQILQVLGRVRPSDVESILAATTLEATRPLRPLVHQMEREVKSLMLQNWLNGSSR